MQGTPQIAPQDPPGGHGLVVVVALVAESREPHQGCATDDPGQQPGLAASHGGEAISPGYAAAMLGVYASAAAILLASVVLGSALLGLLGRTEFTWLSGAVGFAALVVASPLLIRLPGRATTLSVLLAIAFLAAVVYMWRGEPVPGAGRLMRGRRRGGSRPPRRRSAPVPSSTTTGSRRS